MKKWIGLFCVCCLLSILYGCQSKEDTTQTVEKVTQETEMNDKQDTAPGESEQSQAEEAEDCLDLLTRIWEAVPEGERFAAAGGDFSPENQVMDGPGKFGLTDTEALDATLGFPASEVEKVDDAASLVHMMNANTFTCGAFRMVDEKDADALIEKIKENILKRQWMCGFPDELVIAFDGSYMVVMFGAEEQVDSIKEKMQAVDSSMKMVVEEPIAAE